MGQCDHDQGSSLPQQVSPDGYEGKGDQQETEDKSMQDSAGVGPCDQVSSLTQQVSVDGYEGDQQETDEKLMQDSAGVGRCDQGSSLHPHQVSVDGYEGDQQETENKSMQDPTAGVGRCDQDSSLHPPLQVDGYISDTDSVVALEDSFLEHELGKLMMKDSLLSYCSLVTKLFLVPNTSYPENILIN